MKKSLGTILKSGNSFFANHKHIFGGWLMLAIIGFLGNFLFNLGYAYLWGEDVRYFLQTINVASFSAPRIISLESWSMLEVMLYHFIAEIFVAYIGICSIVYILHALRNKEISIIKALHDGAGILVRGWQVVIGIQLLRFIGLYLVALHPTLALARHDFARMAIMGLFWLASLLFLIITFFVYQLVADGSTKFFATIQKSWNYVRFSWAKLLGIVLLLGILVGIIILTMGMLALWKPELMWVTAFVTWSVTLVLSFVYAIDINKIYLQTRTDIDKGH